MVVNRVNGNILAVGERGRHDLIVANAELIRFLQKELSWGGKYEEGKYNGEWSQCETKYSVEHYQVERKRVVTKRLSPIRIYDFPLDPSNLSTLSRDKLPKELKEARMGLVAKVTEGLPILLSVIEDKVGKLCKYENQIVTLERFYQEAKDVFEVLNKREQEIVPGRELLLLFDNGNNLYTPKQFKGYIDRNAGDAGVGYTGHLLDD
jgi:hypothetical protein